MKLWPFENKGDFANSTYRTFISMIVVSFIISLLYIVLIAFMGIVLFSSVGFEGSKPSIQGDLGLRFQQRI
jgi:hypothetical protein